MADKIVIKVDNARGGRGLCKAVTLKNGAAEHNLEVLDNRRIDWGRSSHHATDSSTKKCFDFLKNKGIVASMVIASSCCIVGGLGGEGLVDEPFLAACGFSEPRLNSAIDPVVQTGNRREELRLKFGAVFHKSQGVTGVEANSQFLQQGEREQDLFKRMGVWQVGYIAFTFVHGQTRDRGASTSDDAVVAEFDAFRVACSARGVTKNVDVILRWLIEIGRSASFSFVHHILEGKYFDVATFGFLYQFMSKF